MDKKRGEKMMMRKKLLAMMCMSLFVVAGFATVAQTTKEDIHIGEHIVIPTFPMIKITGADVSSVCKFIGTSKDGLYDTYECRAGVSVNWEVSGGKEAMYPFTAEVTACVSAVQYDWEGGTREIRVSGPGSYSTSFSGTTRVIVPHGKKIIPPGVTLIGAQITAKNSMLFGFAFYFPPAEERAFAGTVYTEEDNGAWYTGRAAYETYTLPDDAFDKNPEQRRNALMQKYSEVFEKIDNNDYQSAINKLENDIRAKMDGSLGGNPKNDWVTDAEAQEKLCSLIDAATGNLREIA